MSATGTTIFRMEFTAHDFPDLVWRVSSQLTLARPVCAIVTNLGGHLAMDPDTKYKFDFWRPATAIVSATRTEKTRSGSGPFHARKYGHRSRKLF